ncbi:MAG: MFS transporter [Muribaculaceae bacterium]|nr:MFS transporter [Muribaculaceae bacterium]
MKSNSLKAKLIVLQFLEFAVWGAYLTCMSNYLGKAGMGSLVSWFYAIQGIVSIFMPAIIGIIADKFVQPQRLLGLCHLIAGVFMCSCWWLGMSSATPDPTLFVTCYTISVAFFMPTIALSNTVSFRVMNDHKMDTIKDFPPIRAMGTVGFIATMWFVNCAAIVDGHFTYMLGGDQTFQYTHWQFFVSGFLSLCLFVMCLTVLPTCPLVKTNKKQTLTEALGLNAFALFKTPRLAVFFVFSMLLGMCLQVTNGYAGPYISHFQGLTEYAESFAAQNPTLLTSLSQISEAMCILLIPFFLRRFGIKIVMFISMMAWVVRFGFLGLGNPSEGLWLFVISMIVYGVAFDFFNVSGALFIEKETDKSIQASAQGLFMLMTNGLGATIGTLAAGKIIDQFCQWKDGFLVGDWGYAWLIFSMFALVVGILFMILFKYKHQRVDVSVAKASKADDPDGFVN